MFQQSTRRIEPALAFTALVLVCIYYQSLSNFVQTVDHCAILSCDYVRYFFRQGKLLFLQDTPLVGFFYGPIFALMMNVFAMIPYSEVLWFTIQLISLMLYLYLGHALLRERSAGLLFAFFGFFSIGVLHTLKWGAISGFVAVSVMASVYLLLKRRQLLAGCIMAFLVAVKFYPLYFLLPFLTHRRINFWLSFCISALLFFLLIPGFLMGLEGMVDFYFGIFAGINTTPFSIDWNSQNFAAIMQRQRGSGVVFWQWSSLAVFALTALRVYSLQIEPESKMQVLLAIAFLVIPFLPIPAWSHYFFAQGFALTCIIDYQLSKGGQWQARIVCFFCLCALLLQSPLPVWWHATWKDYAYWGYPCWSSVFGLCALLVSVWGDFLNRVKLKRQAIV